MIKVLPHELDKAPRLVFILIFVSDICIHSDICQIQPNSKYWDGNAIYHEPPNTPNIILLVASLLVGWYSALKTTNHT